MRFEQVAPLALALGFVTVAAAQETAARPEQERVESLVAAGALPRNALADAVRDARRRELTQTLRETLLNTNLPPHRVSEMVRAASELQRLAREDLARTRELVTAGALPANRLAPMLEAADLADRQLELAGTRAQLIRDRDSNRGTTRPTTLREEDLAAHVSDAAYRGLEEDLAAIDGAFFATFGQPLPISADGQTPLHASLGMDHTGRADIAVDPESMEGQFLLQLLDAWGIPYIAFRDRVPGQSTGPHIHIGPRSLRLEPDLDE